MITYTDSTLMPFGMHKGKPLIAVPGKYLLYIYDNNMLCGNQALRIYIEANRDALLKEAGIKPKHS